MTSFPTCRTDPEGIDARVLRPWLSVTVDGQGTEHAVLSDGRHRIRLDVERGSLACGDHLLLQFQLVGIASTRARLLPLRRLVALIRDRRFAKTLFPEEPRIARLIDVLRVHDALTAGASQKEIARVMFGAGRVERDWNGISDSLRSGTRRLVRAARSMAFGGYRRLLGRVE